MRLRNMSTLWLPLGLFLAYANALGHSELRHSNSNTTKLTLKEVLKKALQEHPDIQLAELEVLSAEANRLSAEADFDFNLSLGASYSEQKTPASSTLDGVPSVLDTRQAQGTFSLSKKMSWGTELELPISTSIDRTNSDFARLNPSTTLLAELQFSQDVLRSFTAGYFLKDLQSAQVSETTQRHDSDALIRERIIEIAGLYWAILAAHQDTQTMSEAADLSNLALRRVKRQKTAGKASTIDLLEAQADVQLSEEKAIQAQLRESELLSQLRSQLFGDRDEPLQLAEFKKPIPPQLPPSHKLDELIQKSLVRRADFLTATTEWELSLHQLRFAQADQNPSLTFEGSMANEGFSGNIGNSLLQVSRLKNLSFSAKLLMEYPLMGYARQGALKKGEMEVKQKKIILDKVKNQIRLELQQAHLEVHHQWKRAEALELALRAEKEKFKAANARFRVGRLTPYELNRARNDRSQAYSQHVSSLVDYRKSLARFFLLSGLDTSSLLERILEI